MVDTWQRQRPHHCDGHSRPVGHRRSDLDLQDRRMPCLTVRLCRGEATRPLTPRIHRRRFGERCPPDRLTLCLTDASAVTCWIRRRSGWLRSHHVTGLGSVTSASRWRSCSARCALSTAISDVGSASVAGSSVRLAAQLREGLKIKFRRTDCANPDRPSGAPLGDAHHV
jgi:hypothetical protein